jgi:hypothetical protein
MDSVIEASRPAEGKPVAPVLTVSFYFVSWLAFAGGVIGWLAAKFADGPALPWFLEGCGAMVSALLFFAIGFALERLDRIANK